MMKYVLMFSAAIVFIPSAWAQGQEPSPEEAKEQLGQLAEQSRQKKQDLTFEQFKETVFLEPFEGGKFIVDGDTPIANEKLLKEFFDQKVKNKPPAPPKGDIGELAVYHVNGLDIVWSNSQKHKITYCVSNTFGPRYNDVVVAMKAAAAAWEAAGNVDFHYIASEDIACDDKNGAVVFDVRPVNLGAYLARAFFPNDVRKNRNVLIDASSFKLDPNGKLTLTGILTHELGHTLGARHEHTRPEAGVCFEDEDYRPLTNYDAFSAMHYPQCNGLGDWSLKLTRLDMDGIACLYDPAAGFVPNPENCKPGWVTKVDKFQNQEVAQNGEMQYGPFAIKPGTAFLAEMHPTDNDAGDADLYVKFGMPANRIDYDCRPFQPNGEETCTVDVPEGKQKASVMVRGESKAKYDMVITYTTKSD